MPTDVATALQWEHTRLRRRMLYGLWASDLTKRVRSALGKTRGEAVGSVDISANPFAAAAGSGAALYDRTPSARCEITSVADAAMEAILRRSGIWAQMQRTQRDTLGMREMLVRAEVQGEPGDLLSTNYQPIPVDLVTMVPDPAHPERPVEIRHAIEVEHWATGRTIWAWDVWSIVDLERPYHRVLSAEGGMYDVNISHHYGLPEGGVIGDTYTARYSDGTPFLPFALYHAARTGRLLDSFHGKEVVEGTLNVGVMWTHFGHSVRNAAWAQRWMLNAQAAGALAGEAKSSRVEVVADPAFVLEIESTEDAQGQPIIGQWTPPVDPQALAEAIGIYERRLAAYADLDPSDVRRVSGDPRSGYAIAIGREGKREAQRRYAPIFAPIDEELVGKTAALHNRHAGTDDLPETGWRVKHELVPLSSDELQARLEYVLRLREAELIDDTQARAMLELAD